MTSNKNFDIFNDSNNIKLVSQALELKGEISFAYQPHDSAIKITNKEGEIYDPTKKGFVAPGENAPKTSLSIANFIEIAKQQGLVAVKN